MHIAQGNTLGVYGVKKERAVSAKARYIKGCYKLLRLQRVDLYHLYIQGVALGYELIAPIGAQSKPPIFKC